MKKKSVLLAALAAALLSGCGGGGSPVGLIDVQRITANWPQYANANNQMLADERAVQMGKGSPAQKQREVAQMQAKYSSISAQARRSDQERGVQGRAAEKSQTNRDA